MAAFQSTKQIYTPLTTSLNSSFSMECPVVLYVLLCAEASGVVFSFLIGSSSLLTLWNAENSSSWPAQVDLPGCRLGQDGNLSKTEEDYSAIRGLKPRQTCTVIWASCVFFFFLFFFFLMESKNRSMSLITLSHTFNYSKLRKCVARLATVCKLWLKGLVHPKSQ